MFAYGKAGQNSYLDRLVLVFQAIKGSSQWCKVYISTCFGVQQDTALGPLFSLYINDAIDNINSEIRLYADDCVCYRQVDSIEDTVKLPKDIDRLGKWARKWA